jgi:histone deacetylase 6
MTTGLLYDERFLRHHAPYEHPEHPDRLSAIWARLEEDGLAARCQRIAAREASGEEIEAVHTAGYRQWIDWTATRDFAELDPDTYACRDSALTARLAAGGLVDLVGRILEGQMVNGFGLLRPPGHHAEADRARGFCLYNNVAVAARAAQKRGARRVLIVDWDLHHGNGTQSFFWDDREVLYFSAHQYPLFPGTGSVHEVGEGAARGRTVNVPLPAGCGDAEYLAAFDRVLLPIAREFFPDLVLVSAGFDSALGDPMGSMRLTPAGYAQMTARLKELAGGRLVLALEGGYNLTAIARSVAACLRILLGEEPPPPPEGDPSPLAARVLDQVRAVQRLFWRGL